MSEHISSPSAPSALGASPCSEEQAWLHMVALPIFCVSAQQEPGKRSQLWRMTGTGMLAHEGSAVPHNPNKPPATCSTEGSAILDIAGLAAVTDNR